MPKSCLDGYLTEGCETCEYWEDGSNLDKGLGCNCNFPIMWCAHFEKMYNENEGIKQENL